jgi:hypothetical protein
MEPVKDSVKDLIKGINNYFKNEENKENNDINDINDINEIKKNKHTNKKKSFVESIESKSIKNNKSTEPDTIKQYLHKMNILYKYLFNKSIDKTIINNLMNSLLNNTYDKILLKNLDFLKDIDVIINTIHDKYKNRNTKASYINAITSILSRIPHFKEQYNIISTINNNYSMEYQEERDKNDAPDKVINNLISFDEDYINNLINNINDINDKSLIAVYTLTPPRRIKDYNLMKITTETDLNKLDNNYNYVIIQNNKPIYFYFLNHKTKKTSEPLLKIPNDLIKILDDYIKYNKLVNNNYLFGRIKTNFIERYTQPKFTEKIQNLFLKYTGKKTGVNILRNSKSTNINTNNNISIKEKKIIAEQMAHKFKTNMQYNKNMGVKRLGIKL